MPYINVTEKDLSWYYRQRDPSQLVVLMTGVSSFGPHEPVLVNEFNFKSTLGDASVNAKDISYNMAYSFVRSGIDVVFWRLPLEDEKTATYSSVTATPNCTLSAKYPGKYGDGLEVKVLPLGSGTYRMFVYNEGALLENFNINLINPDSEYYYEVVNETTQYIQVIVEADDPEISKGTYKLSDGSNGTYDEVALYDYLATSDEANNILNNLGDRLSYDFGYVVAPFNLYNHYAGKFIGDGSTTSFNVAKSIPTPSSSTTEDLKNTLKVCVNGTEVSSDTYTYDATNSVVRLNTAPDKGDEVLITADINTTDEKKSYLSVNTSAIDEKFVSLVKKRGTAVYLVDGDKSWSAEEFFSYTDLPSETSVGILGFNTSYAAAIGPWCISTYVATGAQRVLPGSYVLLVRWAQSLQEGNPIYYAPAGVKRANLNFVKRTMYPVRSAVLDLWQNQDVITSDGHKINPITELKQYGYVVYGNSTLLKNRSDGATSMLQSLSTRVLANLIKRQAFVISLSMQFDQIDNDLFVEFRTLMGEFMDQLQYNGAVSDYEIIADYSKLTMDNLNTRTVPVIIRISPIASADNFDIELEVYQAGVTFGSDSLEDSTEA